MCFRLQFAVSLRLLWKRVCLRGPVHCDARREERLRRKAGADAPLHRELGEWVRASGKAARGQAEATEERLSAASPTLRLRESNGAGGGVEGAPAPACAAPEAPRLHVSRTRKQASLQEQADQRRLTS